MENSNIPQILELIKMEVERRKENNHPLKYYNGILYSVKMDIDSEIIKIMKEKRGDEWN